MDLARAISIIETKEFEMKRILAMAALIGMCFGCTHVKSEHFDYWSVLQKKSLTINVTVDPDGNFVSGDLKFNTDSDPALDLARKIIAKSAFVAP